jgi:hypothetical protein
MPAGWPRGAEAQTRIQRGSWTNASSPSTKIFNSVTPITPPHLDDSPWSSAPLDAGIDHITAYTRYGPSGAGAVDAILELALRHGLVVYDPQFDCIEPDESDDDYA